MASTVRCRSPFASATTVHRPAGHASVLSARAVPPAACSRCTSRPAASYTRTSTVPVRPLRSRRAAVLAGFGNTRRAGVADARSSTPTAQAICWMPYDSNKAVKVAAPFESGQMSWFTISPSGAIRMKVGNAEMP